MLDLLVGGAAVAILLFYWFRSRSWVRLVITGVALVIMLGVSVSAIRIAAYFPNIFVQWIRYLAIFFGAWTLFSIPVVAVTAFAGTRMPGRRRVLKAAANAVLAVPPVMAAVAFIGREELTFREVDLKVSGLPRDLEGLLLVQLSDIHLSPFVSESLLARAVAMANETKADIALVTGDLVSRVGDPLDLCLRHLSQLRSTAGTYGCLGNHEIYANAEEYTTAEGRRLGIRFLRAEAQPLHFGDSMLNLVGVDYQRRGREYLRGAEGLVLPGATNLLLSHNPDVFPVAVSKGFDVTVGGHTHGGQVNFEILEQGVNIVRFFTPYVYGSYEREGKALFVTRGIGTVGAPARLGAPPEVALIRLCAS